MGEHTQVLLKLMKLRFDDLCRRHTALYGIFFQHIPGKYTYIPFHKYIS